MRRSRHRLEAEEKALLVDFGGQGVLKVLLVDCGMAVGLPPPRLRS